MQWQRRVGVWLIPLLGFGFLADIGLAAYYLVTRNVFGSNVAKPEVAMSVVTLTVAVTALVSGVLLVVDAWRNGP